MSYLSPAAEAAHRALSLLSVSLGKSEISDKPFPLSADEIRLLPIWESICEWVADTYGPSNWLEGIPMDIQIIAAVIASENDQYGNAFFCEMQYNAKGHRALIAMPRNELQRLMNDRNDLMAAPLDTSTISVYMD